MLAKNTINSIRPASKERGSVFKVLSEKQVELAISINHVSTTVLLKADVFIQYQSPDNCTDQNYFEKLYKLILKN